MALPKNNGLGYDSDMQEIPDADDDDSVGVTQDGSTVTRDEGGITITLPGASVKDPQQGEDEFDDNLANRLDDNDRIGIGSKLKELVEIDLESRAQWEQRLLTGMEIIGLVDIPEDRAAFVGAAQVTHPGISEAIVQFEARAMEEILPPTGPVKCGTIGDADDDDIQRAQRVEDYMNYQLTDEDDEYYSDTESMLWYIPYAGSGFKKVGIDPVIGRTRSRFVTAEDFIVPYFAKSLQTSPRYTHRYTMPLNIFKRAVEKGNFTDHEFAYSNYSTQQIGSGQLADASDDRSESYHPDDTVLTLCETHIDWEFDWEKEGGKKGFKKPYAITWEWETGAVVSIRRIWAEDDPDCKKQVWFIHYRYLPGFGFYGLGLLHLIGGLGKAASGALRMVLDGSMTASLQGGFKSKDAKIAGDMVLSPGTWIDTDMSAEEMAKAFYTPPFKEPSEALFKTFDIIVNGIQRFASTTENMVGEASNTGPVGTTVALIEQGSKIFSGIHKRLYYAARREFKMIAYCNWRYMEQDEYPYKVAGANKNVFRADFAPDIDVLPVSDPNIFSSVQRIAMAQAVLQMVKDMPGVFSKVQQLRAVRNMMKAMKVPDYEDYVPDEDLPRLDPVSENETVMMGGGINAFPEQDHQAHMQIHGNFMQQVIATGDQDTINKAVPVLKAHMAAHFAMQYRQQIEAQLMQHGGVPLPPFDPNDATKNKPLPIDVENMVARAVSAQLMAQQPPPGAQPPPPDPDEQRKQQAFQADQKRKDGAAAAAEARKDKEHRLKMIREGLIPDSPNPPPANAQAAAPAFPQSQLPNGAPPPGAQPPPPGSLPR